MIIKESFHFLIFSSGKKIHKSRVQHVLSCSPGDQMSEMSRMELKSRCQQDWLCVESLAWNLARVRWPLCPPAPVSAGPRVCRPPVSAGPPCPPAPVSAGPRVCRPLCLPAFLGLWLRHHHLYFCGHTAFSSVIRSPLPPSGGTLVIVFGAHPCNSGRPPYLSVSSHLRSPFFHTG